MTRPWVRVVLAFAGVAALAAAGASLWSSASRTRAIDAALQLAEEASRRALVDAADLRAAQQAYVAVGQGEDFWFARVAALSTDLDDALAVFKSHLSSPEALAKADAAAVALQDFQQVDKHARDLTHARQLSQASDVIFADGFELTQNLTWSIAQAIAAENTARNADAGGVRRRESAVLAAGGGGAALVLLLLTPAATGKRPATQAAVIAKPASAAASPPVVREVGAGTAAARAADVVPRPTASPPAEDLGGARRPPTPRAGPEPSAPDFSAVAAICGDLARVADTRAVPPLLERAAAALDATGIVLWIADPDGRELSPIVVYGYPPQLTTRLGTIPRDADNVTASAFRTNLLQTVKGDAASNGAVAAPLMTPAGCLGVMAVEMRSGGEQRPAGLAAVAILASQLSTLVGPPSIRRAEAAG
jgi:hypothetical protein